MGARFTRGDFRTEEQWKSWIKDCRAAAVRASEIRKQRRMQDDELNLKHDTSLVGFVIVIPKEFVHLRWKKNDFAHLLEVK